MILGSFIFYNMKNKFKNLFESLIEFGYKDITDDIDQAKGKKRIKREKSIILFDYDDVYQIDENAKQTKL